MSKQAKIDEIDQLAEEIKSNPAWHHDIKYIDGDFVEVTVKKWKETQDPRYIEQILANYALFKKKWGRAFAPFMDNDQDDGESMHDKIVWKAACKFKAEKVRKPNGRAFNAYLVSALMNQLKNLRNARMSHKNHPRIQCPICAEQVYQIDEGHLKHHYDLKRYVRRFPNYPLSSFDGLTVCPITGIRIEKVTMEYMNRMGGHYLMEDFDKEYQIVREGPYRCPLTGTLVQRLDEAYFRGFLEGYTEQDFVEDFPDFPGLLRSPFSGEKLIAMTQAHLDQVLNEGNERFTKETFQKQYPNFTMEARQVPVVNPYTGRKVKELTPAMLARVGTNVQRHLGEFATISLDKRYYELISCPFTGRRTQIIRTSDLEKIGKTVQDFYQATCRYPFRKFQVKCALCGEWVDNVWDHLAEVNHEYAASIDMEAFEKTYGSGATKLTVTTNSYVESDSGDSIHIADLFGDKAQQCDMLEIEDSLMRVASDEMDRSIAAAVRTAFTLEDVCFVASRKEDVYLDFVFEAGKTKEARDCVQAQLGTSDFDLLVPPETGETEIKVMVPSRQTIRKRLKRMIDASDLG